MLPRLSHELLLVTVIQFLVVKYPTDFRAPPPKILSPSQNLTLTCITHDASSQLSRSRSFFDLVKILKLVASASSDFFDSDREKHKAAHFMAALVQDVTEYLNACLTSLASNHPLLETCAPDVFLRIRTTPAAGLNLLQVLETSLDHLLTNFASGCRKEAVRAALAARALGLLNLPLPSPSQPTASQFGFSSFGTPAHAPTRAPPPPPTPAGSRTGTLPGQGNRPCRFALGTTNACALCGKGSTPGSVGHRASTCPANASEIDNWVQHAVPVI